MGARRMYSKNQLIKLIEEHAGEGTKVYRHNLTITFDGIGSSNTIYGTLYSTRSTPYTSTNDLPANTVITCRGTANDPVGGLYFSFELYTDDNGTLNAEAMRYTQGDGLTKEGSSTVLSLTDSVVQAI